MQGVTYNFFILNGLAINIADRMVMNGQYVFGRRKLAITSRIALQGIGIPMKYFFGIMLYLASLNAPALMFRKYAIIANIVAFCMKL